MVSVMYHCSQTLTVDFLEFLLKKYLKNLKKSASKFVKNKKLRNMFVNI